MGRFVSSALVLLGAFLLQITFAPAFAIGGVVPNVMFVAVVVIAFVRGSREGMIVGFSAGLLFDLVTTAAFGPMILTLTLVGFLAGTLQEFIFSSGWVLPLTVLGITSLIAEIFYLTALIFMGENLPFFVSLYSRVLPGVLYALFIGVLLFPLLSPFLRKTMSVEVSTLKRIS
jgi:rod shape-determining protein MreD